MESPFIHLFKTNEGNYLYDVNKNTVVKLDKVTYDFLGSMSTISNTIDNKTFDACKCSPYIEKLYASGFLSSNHPSEIVNPITEIIEPYLNNKVWMITLQVTQQCNLRCEYCVYSGSYENRYHTNKRMNIETAKKCIDFLIEHSRDNKQIAIGFYGGEPLLEFDLIKKSIEYAEERGEGKDLLYSITTNATLLDENIIEYFERYKVSLIISLDGPSETHDKNRKFASNNKGSFEKVMKNLENIKLKFPEYFKRIRFNAVLNPENDFSCLNKFFTDYETIRESDINTSFISDSYRNEKIETSDDFLCKVNYEYFKLFLSKLGKLNEEAVSKLVVQYYQEKKRFYLRLEPSGGKLEKIHHSGPCIPGINRLFVNTEGVFYPCERVSENSEIMKIGHLDYGFDIDKVKALLNIGKLTEEKCKNCWALRFCTLCAAAADGITTFSVEKKTSACSKVRLNAENQLKEICVLREKNVDLKEELLFDYFNYSEV